jgi:hypothetical protein
MAPGHDLILTARSEGAPKNLAARNKLLAQAAQVLPRRTVLRMVRELQSSR